MTEYQSTGELLTNGNFATGDFSGWSVTHPESIFLARQEHGHVAVLMPIPYGTSDKVRQVVFPDRASGSYVLSFWLRTSDKRGDAFPDLIRKATIHLWLHAEDGGGSTWTILDTLAAAIWIKHVYRFSLEDRGRMRFEIYFKNENGGPDELRSPPVGLEGYQQLDVINESPDLALPADVQVGECPYAIRDVSLFKTA